MGLGNSTIGTVRTKRMNPMKAGLMAFLVGAANACADPISPANFPIKALEIKSGISIGVHSGRPISISLIGAWKAPLFISVTPKNIISGPTRHIHIPEITSSVLYFMPNEILPDGYLDIKTDSYSIKIIDSDNSQAITLIYM